METIDQAAGMDPKAKAELQDVCDRVAEGVQTTTNEKRASLASLNELRERIRQRIGVQNVAVDLVRQSRDSR